jgi:choline dehydrogenase-like flavoprotein
MTNYDVIIIGSGAGGGTLARHLAPSGKKILILERGGWLKREIENWDAASVFEDNRYISPDTWYDKEGKGFQPQVHYFVGGATKMYGAALYRLREKDFGELKHYDGISPAWPISYEELEPYYTLAEKMYYVHGERGIDPTEPPCGAPFLILPFLMSHVLSSFMKILKGAITTRSLHPAPSCSMRKIPLQAAASAAKRAMGSLAWSRPRRMRRW